ncbi:MAG TPA: hypothetical protein VEK57_07750 [Thermoanaerobaculia bacterium]|nr:hypothetical protein [Thermoanaerobaculia bacterium]
MPEAIEEAITSARARLRIGYPWWLRPLLLRDVAAITLGRCIYVRHDIRPASLERLLRHELAHIRQIERHGLFGFYWRYLAEFGGHLWRERSVSRAYRLISFEVEAAAAEEGL